MLALRLESLAADWQVRRFNPNHAPPGAGGGQFTSGPQGGAQAAKQQKPQRAANARAARAKGNLLKRARADDAEAGKLEGQLKGLRAQQAQALAAAGRHRTAKAHHAKQHKAAREHPLPGAGLQGLSSVPPEATQEGGGTAVATTLSFILLGNATSLERAFG